RTNDSIAYGHDLELDNFEYAKNLTAVNAISLASIAWAPPAPTQVEIGGAVAPSTKLRWKPVEGAVGYTIYWRDTTSPTWDHSRYVGDTHEFTLEGIVIDNFFFGLASVGPDGHARPVVLPGKTFR